jgi:hypothetical protein
MMLPLLATAGWVCLYLWWQQGGAALLTACGLLESLSVVILLSLLRHQEPGSFQAH